MDSTDECRRGASHAGEPLPRGVESEPDDLFGMAAQNVRLAIPIDLVEEDLPLLGPDGKKAFVLVETQSGGRGPCRQRQGALAPIWQGPQTHSRPTSDRGGEASLGAELYPREGRAFRRQLAGLSPRQRPQHRRTVHV